jgi:hypothetical protein
MISFTRAVPGAHPVRPSYRGFFLVSFCSAIVAVTCFTKAPAGWAAAPSNGGGVLMLHVESELPYEYGTFDHCGDLVLSDPARAVTRLPGDGIPRLVGVYAVFPPDSVGAIRVVSFGVRYSKSVRVVGQVPCNAGGLSIVMNGWPASNGGMSVHVPAEAEKKSRVIPLYWFAVLAKGQGSLELIPHPLPKLAGRFLSVEVPYEQEPIVGYGRIGFDSDGFVPAPGAGAVVAPCCCVDGCWLLTKQECELYRGDFLGIGMTCDNSPCREDAYLGGCCLPEGCRMLTLVDCARGGGAPLGEGARCDSVPCPKPIGAGVPPK